MHIQVRLESPASPDAMQLIEELQAHLGAQYPVESQHGYSIEQLLRERVAFFVARLAGDVAGCGGVQHYTDGYGELKRMYVRPAFRGRGVARALLERLAAQALRDGAAALRLETGIHQHEAIALYVSAGFREIGPFGPYTEDPNSRFFEKPLA